jgi:NAD(P)H-flavin reductase
MAIVDPGASGDRMWDRESRFNRRAVVVGVDRLTVTGTVRIRAKVADNGPFDFKPGQFVAIEDDVQGVGVQHSPYCLFTPANDNRRFELLLRVFPEGPLSHWLASLPPGSPLRFRGPSGRSMVPKEQGTELVLMATGVGISPFRCLLVHLLQTGDRRRIRLYWGLRLAEDICLTDDLDRLVDALPDFRYEISLSQPPPDWTGLRGRLTESVPPLLETLGGKRFYLSGNGAMCEEMEIALSDQGVDRTFIHQERFFNARHRADQATIDAMLARFVARDLFSPHAEQQAPLLFAIERDVHGRRVGGDPS